VYPSDGQGKEPPAIEIDLKNNSYCYRGWSSEDAASPTTVRAVPLSAYTGGRTAYIASLASFVGLS
jgi:hypothetical protein